MSNSTIYEAIEAYKASARLSIESFMAAVAEYKEVIKQSAQASLESAKTFIASFPAWAKASLQSMSKKAAYYASQTKDYAIYMFHTFMWGLNVAYQYTKAAGYYLVENAHKLPKILWTGIKNLSSQIVQQLGILVSNIRVLMSNIGEALKLKAQQLLELGIKVLDGLSMVAKELYSFIKHGLQLVWDNLYNIPKWIMNGLTFVKDLLVEVAKLAYTKLVDMLKAIATKLHLLMTKIVSGIQVFATYVLESIQWMGTQVLNFVINLPKHLAQIASFLSESLVQGVKLLRELSSQLLSATYDFIKQSLNQLHLIVSQGFSALQSAASASLIYLAQKIGMGLGIAYAIVELTVEGIAAVAQAILPEQLYGFLSTTIPSGLSATLHFLTTGMMSYVSGATLVTAGGYFAYKQYSAEAEAQPQAAEGPAPARADAAEPAPNPEAPARPAVLNQFRQEAANSNTQESTEVDADPRRSPRRAQLT